MNFVQRIGLVCALSGALTASVGIPVGAQTPKPAAPAAPAAPKDGPMSRNEVAERLNIVPVFTIVSKDGTPVLANVNRDGKQVQVASFWLDQTQANTVIDQIKKTSPDIGKQAQVVPMSLGYAYQIAEGEKPKDLNIVFQVLPREAEVKRAIDLAKKGGQDLKDFPGVPLFYGVSDQGLLTVERDGVEVIPFFFDSADLQNALTRVSSVSPDIVKKTRIEVTSLAQVVGSMLDGKAKADIRKIAFVPARSALEYIQKLPPSQQSGLDPIGRQAAGIGSNTTPVNIPGAPKPAKPAKP